MAGTDKALARDRAKQNVAQEAHPRTSVWGPAPSAPPPLPPSWCEYHCNTSTSKLPLPFLSVDSASCSWTTQNKIKGTRTDAS